MTTPRGPVTGKDRSLRSFNTMGVDVRAARLAEFHSVSGLREIIQFCRTEGQEVLILGGGSNMLFTGDVSCCVAVNRMKGIEILSDKDGEVLVKAAGGENWHGLVEFAVARDLGGIENLALIPGTVGAAPIQNIGAYGVELSDVFVELEALDLNTDSLQIFGPEACRFGYRNSIFKQELKGKAVIISVSLRLNRDHIPDHSYSSLREELDRRKITEPTIRDVFEAVITVRSSKLPDPARLGNTGSFFKNPVISAEQFEKLKQQFPAIPGYTVSEMQIKVPAGWLIEQAGWKGYRSGDAGVHSKQALVLVNYGGASGQEIWELAEKIRESVNGLFGIELQPEVNIIEP